MTQVLSPREVFLALVNGVAEGRWSELPDLYAEQTHVVHPFDPLRAAALRTRDELREHFRPTGSKPSAATSGSQHHDPRDDRPRGHRRRVRVPGNSRGDRRTLRAARYLRAAGARRSDHQLPRLFRPCHRRPSPRATRHTCRSRAGEQYHLGLEHGPIQIFIGGCGDG